MCYTARAVANDFLDRAWYENRTLAPLAMHHLVYLAHGWYRAKTEVDLVQELFEAWPIGPVIPDLEAALRTFGGGPIWRKLADGARLPHVDPEDLATLKVLDFVWRKYSRLSDSRLAELTCGDGTPWSRYVQSGPPRPIPAEDINHYFLDLVAGIEKRAS